MNAATSHLILIGLRGSGKTTLGRLLAERLQRAFIDVDTWIEQRAARTIAEIFAAEGEPAFRKLEEAALADALREPPAVIATGGGAVLSVANCERMRVAGVCIWLTAPVGELHRRVQRDPRSAESRPALTGLTAEQELLQLSQERAPLYQKLATLVITTAGRLPTESVREVLRMLRLGW